MRAFKILLTGATGFIGTNFVLNLHEKYKITALVRENSDISKIKDKCEIYIYKNDFKALQSLFSETKFDGIVHLAGLVPTATKPSNDLKELFEANILFGTELLEASKDKIKFFINAASFASYCNSLSYRPATLYGATKKAFEDIMTYYALTSDVIYTNLLIFNVYGPNDKSLRLFKLLDEKAKSGEALEMSDGMQIVDYSHVYDVVAGFDKLIEICLKEPNFARDKIFALKGARMSLKELIGLYESVTKQKIHIIWGARAKKPLDIIMPWQGGEILPNYKAKIGFKKGFKMLNENFLDLI